MGLLDRFRKTMGKTSEHPAPPDPIDRVPISQVDAPPIEPVVYQPDDGPSEPIPIPINPIFNEATYLTESTMVKTINPPEPCGFNFDNVLVHEEQYTDKETGEIFKETQRITLQGINLEKVKDDFANIAPIADETRRFTSNWVTSDFFMPYLDLFQGTGRNDLIRFSGNIEVAGLTDTGRVRKFPITVDFGIVIQGNAYIDPYLGVVDKGECTLSADLGYLKSGEVGKARVITWHEHKGVICNIASKDGSLYVKSIKVDNPIYDENGVRVGISGWEYVYKA